MKWKIYLMVIGFCFFVSPSVAQTKKSISLSNQQPFSDPLTFKEDAKDMDLTVNFLFDEDSNTLFVTLVSSRTPFVFWSDVCYKDIFSHRWLHPDRLPYVVSSNAADRYRITKGFRKTLPRCRRKHLFAKWFDVDGLQPIASEIRLVNDSIVQSFVIQEPRGTSVTFRLRDVMVLDEVKQEGTGRYYDIAFGKDFNLQYRITLQRNPCLGLDDEVASAQGSLEAIKKCYASFQRKYATGKVSDQASMNDFQEMKEILSEQFPASKSISLCPDIQQAREHYNLLVDSIQRVNVTLDTTSAVGVSPDDHALNAKNILANARLLDRTVSRWLGSDDASERSDLQEQCRSIIDDTSQIIAEIHNQSSDERLAIDLFHKAENYFKRVCK